MPDGFDLSLVKSPDLGATTRREALLRLGAGAIFVITATKGEADEERVGPRKQPLLTSRFHVGDDGVVTLLTGKVECGQGIRTTLAQVAAEELHLPLTQVRLVMGDTALVPDDGGTWGSLTTPDTVPVVRQASAALRELLCRSTAAEWKVDASTLTVMNGKIVGSGSRLYSYADLAKNPLLSKAVNVGGPTRSPANWQICGTPVGNVNGPSIVSGSQQYSSDLAYDGMLHGRVVRPPNYRCRLVSFNAAAAERLEGVRVIHNGDFLGLTAPTAAGAAEAVALINAEWSQGMLGDPQHFIRDLKASAKPPQSKEFGRYPAVLERGSLSAGRDAGEHHFESTYSIAPIAHVPLEARTAVAQWLGDSLTIRCGTQAPFVVRAEIAETLKVSVEKVRIIVSDTGSGYGAKHNSECELESARLAQGVNQPVRLAWTREEEFTQSYSRPPASIEVRSAVRPDGRITGWEFHNYNGGAASLNPPYTIPNLYAAYHESEGPLRQGSYRSLAAVGNTFAREIHMDEIAATLNIDALELRLRNTDNARLKTVLDKAASRFSWGRHKSGNGVGYGLACNVEKGGHLALFTELQVSGTEVKLTRIVAAFDAGAVINPDILSNQVEGAIIQGIGGALFERIDFDKTRILNTHLASYRVPRFSDVPDIEVMLIDDRAVTSAGAGESPITVTAPSIGSALFAATGKRIRSLPMLPILAKL